MSGGDLLGVFFNALPPCRGVMIVYLSTVFVLDTCSHEGHQMRCIDSSPVGLGDQGEFEGHGQACCS